MSKKGQEKWGNVEIEKMKIETGLLGKIFGSGENFKIYTAGIIVLLLVLAIIGVLAINGCTKDSINVISILAPILTLIIGYMFGHRF